MLDGVWSSFFSLISGPSRKRHVSSSNSEEDEKENEKSKIKTLRSPRMKPRKLFKSCKAFSKISALTGKRKIVHEKTKQELHRTFELL